MKSIHMLHGSVILRQFAQRLASRPLQSRRVTFRTSLRSRSDAVGPSDDEDDNRFGVPVKHAPKKLSAPLDQISARPEMENRVQLIGFLARDPEFFEFKTGTFKAVLSLGLVHKRTRRKQWFEAHVWGPMALSVKEHLQKGEEIYVLGKLQQETWADTHTGRNRSKVTILAQSIKTLRFPTSHPYPEHLKRKQSHSEEETHTEDVESGSVNPHDFGPDEEGNLQMPPAVKEIIWSHTFPDLPEEEWVRHVQGLGLEAMWKLLFQRPKEFWDQRGKKRKPKKDACFRHLLTERPLWIHRKTTPDWARFNIKFLPSTALYDI